MGKQSITLSYIIAAARKAPRHTYTHEHAEAIAPPELRQSFDIAASPAPTLAKGFSPDKALAVAARRRHSTSAIVKRRKHGNRARRARFAEFCSVATLDFLALRAAASAGGTAAGLFLIRLEGGGPCREPADAQAAGRLWC